MSNFQNFDLDQRILTLLEEIGYVTPTPIQDQVIPKILEGVDVIASAQTGTGKTAAFLLPLLHALQQPGYKDSYGPQILVVVPTRELAMQVADEAKKFSRYLPKTKVVCIYGGVPYPIQRKAMSGRYEILVATPGRLIDHLEQGRINLSGVKALVLDEADRMLDMGFIDAIEEIARQTPEEKQTLLFSATIDRKILPVSKKLQKEPHEVKAERCLETQNNIEQKLYYVDNVGHKTRLLEQLLINLEINQSIIFTSTKNQSNELADYLAECGYSASPLHGDMNQRQRTRAINKLRSGEIQFLVATDVAARGIDIPTLSHVINFDLPFQADDFIHRIGRTGRAGATGVALTFAAYKEQMKVVQINKMLGKEIEVHTVPGFEPKPREQSKGRSSRGGGRPAPWKKRERDGGFAEREHREGNFTNTQRKEGSSFFENERKERSFDGERKERSFGGERREGGFGGERRERNFGGERKERSFGGERREGGFGGERRERSFGGERREGGFGGERKPRSFDGERRERKEFGFARGRKREGGFGDRRERREGGFSGGPKREGGFRKENNFAGGESAPRKKTFGGFAKEGQRPHKPKTFGPFPQKQKRAPANFS